MKPPRGKLSVIFISGVVRREDAMPAEEALVGVVLGVRRGLNRQYQREALIKVEGCDDRAAASSLIGSWVELVWKSGKAFRGRVVALHGSRGVVVARFRRGLPGGVGGLKVKLFKASQG